jgi:hypothetical protein
MNTTLTRAHHHCAVAAAYLRLGGIQAYIYNTAKIPPLYEPCPLLLPQSVLLFKKRGGYIPKFNQASDGLTLNSS